MFLIDLSSRPVSVSHQVFPIVRQDKDDSQSSQSAGLSEGSQGAVWVSGSLCAVGSRDAFLPPLSPGRCVLEASCTLLSVFGSPFAFTLETMVQSVGSAQAPLAHQGDTAEMPQAGMGWPHH